MSHPFQSLYATAFGLAVILAVLAPAPDAVAADAYLKIAGIKGESTAKDHKDEIEILSWSLGEPQPAGAATVTTSAAAKSTAARATSGAGAVDPTPAANTAKRQHNPITFTKRIDKSSPMLQKANADHQVFPSVTLSLPNPNGAGNSYLRYELKEVMVSSYQTSAGEGGEAPTETVTFVYGTLHHDKSGAAGSTD